jgi:hypothetical protein
MSTKPIVINLAGGPGAGKSTTRAGVFSLLKLHGINAEEAPEFAKDLTWERRSFTLENQFYIFGKQHHRLFRLQNDVDVIVTDSPLFLSVIYSHLAAKRDHAFCQTVLNAFAAFDNITYLVNRVKPYNPKGRSQSEGEAKDLDSLIRMFLNENGIPFDTVDGNYNGINQIAEKILLEQFGIGLKIKLSEKNT